MNIFLFPTGLEFESYDGGRDSKERLLQGLLLACKESPNKSLIVVFTDNGSKDLILKNDVMRLKKEKDLEIFIGKYLTSRLN